MTYLVLVDQLNALEADKKRILLSVFYNQWNASTYEAEYYASDRVDTCRFYFLPFLFNILSSIFGQSSLNAS